MGGEEEAEAGVDVEAFLDAFFFSLPAKMKKGVEEEGGLDCIEGETCGREAAEAFEEAVLEFTEANEGLLFRSETGEQSRRLSELTLPVRRAEVGSLR